MSDRTAKTLTLRVSIVPSGTLGPEEYCTNRFLQMPLYFFDLKDGVRVVDPGGLNCADDTDAMAKARIIARELERSGHVDLDPNQRIAVIDNDGLQIGTVPIRREPLL